MTKEKNTISASKFQKKCLSLLDNVPTEGIIITKHGQPVAKLIPYHATSSHLIGALKNKIKIHSDNLFSTGIKWDAQS